ncbi:MAG: DUF4111 domain-containing protein [Defluviitaleaceae bacterium]|nr:DUF4111 domain-containing protein [Defluviitaleaceae bacterium]
MDYKPLLQTISERYTKILGNNLVGIYVHGSIAFQCFTWENSDIDFIVVVEHELTQQNKLDLLQVLYELKNEAPIKGFEMSIVQQKYCKPFVYPTPYELHFSNSFLEAYAENPLSLCTDEIKTDVDLAAHFTVINHAGVVLCGQPISQVFGDVPKADYLDSIRLDIENARQDVLDNPVYVVLNLCRVYAFIQDNLVLSKKDGGQWGLDHLPEQYRDVITEALDCYLFSKPLHLDNEARTGFCDCMLEKVFK